MITEKEILDFFKEQKRVRDALIIYLREFDICNPDRDKRCNLRVSNLVFNVIVGLSIDIKYIYDASYYIKELDLGIYADKTIPINIILFQKRKVVGFQEWEMFDA